VAQIALAVVAIFGYFYTVLPVYQKERLAEQVAEYEGIIKKQAPKIAEAEGGCRLALDVGRPHGLPRRYAPRNDECQTLCAFVC
jgi:hypothetical protein